MAFSNKGYTLVNSVEERQALLDALFAEGYCFFPEVREYKYLDSMPCAIIWNPDKFDSKLISRDSANTTCEHPKHEYESLPLNTSPSFKFCAKWNAFAWAVYKNCLIVVKDKTVRI